MLRADSIRVFSRTNDEYLSIDSTVSVERFGRS